jgi:hypothetical protein
MTNKIKQLQVAVSGYDAVAYFDGQAIAGDPAFSSIHNEACISSQVKPTSRNSTLIPSDIFRSTAATARPQPAKESFLESIQRTSRSLVTNGSLCSIAVLVVTRFRNGTRTKRNVALLPTNTGAKAASKHTPNRLGQLDHPGIEKHRLRTQS